MLERAAPLIALRGAKAGYGDGAFALREIDLTIWPGERVAILGRSGAGKSTLLSLLYRQLAVEAALIPQASALVRTLSVFHNVYMGRLDRRSTAHNLRTLIWPAAADLQSVADTLRLVEMEDLLRAQAGALSGGQQQRVSIARAFYNGRPVIIGDEPVSALDRLQGAAVLDRMCEQHGTVILAMHDVGLALARSDRVIVMDAGAIVLDAPSGDLNEARLASFYEGRA